MKVQKRNGRLINFNPAKITDRIRKASVGLRVEADKMSIKVISQMADNITTEELDTLCIEIAASLVPSHTDYSTLASRLFVTQLRKSTPDTFSQAMRKVQDETEVLSEEFMAFVFQNKTELNQLVVQDRDFGHDIFGLRTLEKSYLLRGREKSDKSQGGVIERPQYMWLRTAIEVGAFSMPDVIESYEMMSNKYFTHATPTLFNSGTKLSQLSSCFLLANKADSIDGLFDTMKSVAKISGLAGGIGLHVHNVRSKGSRIKGTNGRSDGILPMLKTYNEVARWINQGGKRKGSFAIYIEPWHADIFSFLELKKNHGAEELRARDLFYAIWSNDLFLERVKSGGDWTLFCPNEIATSGHVPLQDLVGEDFKIQYENLETMGLGRKTIKARELWEKIMVSQLETGVPYLLHKDRANISSNQKNLGVIKSSNLCAEIIEYSDDKEDAVCNLASIALPMFVEKDKRGVVFFNKSLFRKAVRRVIINLDNVIDANYYPTKETKTSNSKHRPVGLGVQGLADVFVKFRYAFDSPEAKQLNKDIFEHMYFYALEASMEMAMDRGAYASFKGSPASKGILQFDMYEETPDLDPELDWASLKVDIQRNGLRNSLLIALMPTASTSQILGNNECFEPFTSNLYTRRVLSGEYVVCNTHLVEDLEALGLWDDQMKNELMRDNGSVLNIGRIPTEIKEIYKTAYEISMKSIIDMAADRQRFVCQAQSMNLFMEGATESKLTSMHFYAHSKKLKTGMYYLRTKSAVDAKKFTVKKEEALKVEVEIKPINQGDFKAMIEQGRNAVDNDEDCLACGS